MRLARIEIDGLDYAARIDEAGVHPLITTADSPLTNLLATPGPRNPERTDPIPADRVELLSPIARPGSIIAVGLNYAKHAQESGMEPPAAPITFPKLPQSVIGPGEVIEWSSEHSTQVDYEAELALVMLDDVRNVSVETALHHVLGYTCCNDVSARDAQFSDGQWLRSKSFDTFCPLGPVIVTPDEIPDPQNLRISCRVNGETRQDSNTSDMIFGVAEIISYLSRFLTLRAGDVITTGTPAGVALGRSPSVYLADGDIVEVEIEGIGVLSNTCSVS